MKALIMQSLLFLGQPDPSLLAVGLAVLFVAVRLLIKPNIMKDRT